MISFAKMITMFHRFQQCFIVYSRQHKLLSLFSELWRDLSMWLSINEWLPVLRFRGNQIFTNNHKAFFEFVMKNYSDRISSSQKVTISIQLKLCSTEQLCSEMLKIRRIRGALLLTFAWHYIKILKMVKT